MTLADLPVLNVFKSKMRWHQSRQNLLAENVANADTPGFQGKDLKKASFQDLISPQKPMAVSTVRTDRLHLAGAVLSPATNFAQENTSDWETTPDGNGVVLEEQMMKVAENQMEYQMAATVYQRSLGLLKTAIGRG